MNIDGLRKKLLEEDLNINLLLVWDSRRMPFQQTARPPHTVVLNVTGSNKADIYIYDERGYRMVTKSNLTEAEACEVALIAVRNGTKIIDETFEIMSSMNKKK